jgi:hypothetical protein
MRGVGGSAVQALAGLCVLLFVVVCSVVGARVLLLARRTGGRPELLMGAGMLLIAALGYPLTLVAGFGGATGGVNLPLYVTGSGLTQVGIFLIYLFTLRVFRPGVGWARGIAAAGAGFMLVSLVGTARSLAVGDPQTPSYLVARTWLAIGIVGYSGGFLWTAVEGLVHHRMARRRLALGLADPVVANRFLLWGLFGLAATGIDAASALANGLGVDPSHSLVVLGPMGLLGAAASAVMYLAFFPPEWYLERVRGPVPA